MAASPPYDAQVISCALFFYNAVRDLKPVWLLEDMRTMETLYQEDAVTLRSYSPSEALLYAVVHDHQAYARYLLGHYAGEALATPGEHFCCYCGGCGASVPHLAMAVRYDRLRILGLILQEVRRMPSVPWYMDTEAGYLHAEGPQHKTPLHLACELLRPDAVLMLLGGGASPHVADRGGVTPLDVILERLRDPRARPLDGKQCLDNLLMFMPEFMIKFKMKGSLVQEPECWSEALGEDTFRYLVGQSPAPLVLIAMRTVLKQLSPAGFPESLHQLPIPSSLKPLGLPSWRGHSL